MEDMKKPLIPREEALSSPLLTPVLIADDQRVIPVFPVQQPPTDANDNGTTQRAHTFPANVIVSSRYNVLNFLPKSLLEQFRRLANVYFLVIGIIALIGQYTAAYQTAIEPAGILAPMMIVVFISVIKDGVEDVKRHQQDNAINNRPARVLCPDGTLKSVSWREIGVGDCLVVLADEELPADCVVVRAGGIQGSCCYVETAAIDGETNLKLKLPVSAMSAHSDAQGDSQKETNALELSADKTRFVGNLDLLRCTITAEAPNSSIHRFNASAQLAGVSPTHDHRVALSEKNLLLRGSVLRATEWCVCAVVYTGAHTKLSLNSKRPPSKLSSVDRIVNRTLLIAISAMIVVCCISMIFSVAWQNQDSNASYLCLNKDDRESEFAQTESGEGGCESSAPSSFLNFFTFATLYNNFVCISMYVSLEMVYLAQAFFVSNDLSLYDEETDTPAECHTSGMCADLGQVQYVLSDKTGTLTKNQMVVQQLSFGKHIFGEPLTVTHDPSQAVHTTHKDKQTRERELQSMERTSRISLNDVELSHEGDAALLTEGSLFHPSLSLVRAVLGTQPSIDTPSASVTDNEERERLLNFLRVLLYCNTAMLMPGEGESVDTPVLTEAQLRDRLQAESPDEVALLLFAAAECGVLLQLRSHTEIVSRGLDRYRPLNTHTQSTDESSPGDGENAFVGGEERVQLLAINEFDSDRKMMSVLVRVYAHPQTSTQNSKDYKTYLLCKGADSSVLSCITKNTEAQQERVKLCSAHIDYFANTGLRTLAFAVRELRSDEEVQAWLSEYLAARNALSQRQEALSAVARKIEREMDLLGAIGIEDELQDGVAESISMLHAAALNVWMITGDKAETAVAIAKKCALIRPTHSEVERMVNLSDTNTLTERVKALHGKVMMKKELVKNDPSSTALSSLALLVDGLSLEGIYSSPELTALFVDIAQCVPTVIACRVSPLQKAALVRLVKSAPSQPVTLGIGDGANDVGMIHESRVGVGISGKEGRHAANAADFAIAQFRFIVPLLLEHGRFNYIRCAKLVLYSFFKNLLLVSVLFYFCTYSGFSGTIPLDSIVFSGYNFYLGLPVLVLGATDWDIARESVYKYPKEAYSTGRLGEMLNLKNMAKWCIFAFIQGLLLFVVAIRFVSGPTSVEGNDGSFAFSIYGTGLNTVSEGQGLGIYAEGFLLYTVCVFAMQYKVIAMFVSPNLLFWALWLLSFAGYFLFTYLYSLFPLLNWYDAVPLAMSHPEFWLAVVSVPLLVAISDYAFEQLNSAVDPSSRDLLLHKLATDAKQEDRRSDATASSGFCMRPLTQTQSKEPRDTSIISPLASRGESIV